MTKETSDKIRAMLKELGWSDEVIENYIRNDKIEIQNNNQPDLL